MTKDGTNGYDEEQIKLFMERIDACFDELATLTGEHMNRCKGPRKRIVEIVDEAKAAGINKKAMKAKIKARDYERKMAKLREDLEADEQDSFDRISEALGDYGTTPLGEATLRRARPQHPGVTGADLDSLAERGSSEH
jgi:uncharacterized protein (UPF0335 family)